MNTRILKLPEVMKATALSRSTLYSYIKDNSFPQPVPLGSRAVGWLESEISDWINQKAESRGVIK